MTTLDLIRAAAQRIVYNPCDKGAQRRNEAATREALEQLVDYLENLNINTGSGDGIIFFEVQENAVGEDYVSVAALDIANEFEVTEDLYDAYDYTPIKRFSRNFHTGAYGVGRYSPEIADNAITIIELSGPARFVRVTLTTDMWEGPGEATATVNEYWGAYPNARSPGSTITIHDSMNLAPHAHAGDIALGIWDDSNAEYVLANLNDEEMIFFRLDESQVGQKSVLASEMIFAETVLGNGDWVFTDTGRTVRVWDLSIDRRFAKNFEEGFYGIGRQALEIGNDHVVVVEIEGRARFIDGPSQDAIPRGGSGTVTISNHWGGYSNLFKDGPNEVEVVDRDRFGPIDIGDLLVAVWDEQAQEYVVLFTNNVPENPAVMGIGEICNGETNECCVWDGIVHINNGPGESGCVMDRCFQRVWIACENRDLLPEHDYCAEGGYFTCSGSKPNFCGWVRDTGKTLSCGGVERPVWTMACPCDPCECPDTCEIIHGRWEVGDSICQLPDFELACVPEDPITESAVAGLTYYWGEFSIEGKYPLMGYDFPLDSTHHPSGLDYTPAGGTAPDDTFNVGDVFVVFRPNGDGNPCAAGQLELYVEGPDGIHYPLDPSGVYLNPLGSVSNYRQLILTDDNCATFVDRTFYYGVVAVCGGGSWWVRGSTIYHLPGGDAYSLRGATTATCGCDEDVTVPGPDCPRYEDDNALSGATLVSSCCGVSPYVTTDTNFGYNDSSVRAVASGCISSGLLSPDENSVRIPFETMRSHAFGGCLDYYEKILGTSNPTLAGEPGKIKTCGGNASVPDPKLYFLWGGRSKECA